MIAALPMLLLGWAKGALAWLARLPWQVWAVLGLCVALWAFGHWRYKAGEDEVQSRWDAAEAAHAATYTAQAEDARLTEARWRADYDAAVSRLNKENTDALAEHDRVVAGLRAGTVRLRKRFRCPSTGLSGAAEAAAGSDGTPDAGFTVEDAGIAFGIARDGDAAIRQLTACQAILRDQR